MQIIHTNAWVETNAWLLGYTNNWNLDVATGLWTGNGPSPPEPAAPPLSLAVGQPASADSSQSGHPASDGNDENVVTRWCANDGNTGHWWEVDLGGVYNLTGTVVYWEASGAYQYRIDVSTNNSSWVTVVNQTANTTPAGLMDDEFSASARYVRITATGLPSGLWASFYEFRVFGSEAPSITTQPVSYTNPAQMYSGVPITLSVVPSGSQPFYYQWFQIIGGVTNAIPDATNASFTHFSQNSDTNGALNLFVVVTNSYGSVTSSLATLALNNIMPGTPDALSVQYTITNYAGYSGGFFLAPTDTAGVYAVSNWNVFVITPAGGGAGTQPGVVFTNLLDRFGVMTPVSLIVVNVSDGWHQTAQIITSADTANARMMNTFWKTHNDASPTTNVLYTTFTNIPNGIYSAYVYLLQNNPGAAGYVYSVNGVTNYFQEFTAFSSASNFVTVR